MIIDIHGHISPPDMLRRFPMPPSLGDIAGMIEQKLEAGIGLTIVGSPVGAGAMMRVPGVDNYAQPVDKLRSFHEWLAGTVHEHEGHLKAYVYTNPFGGDELLDAAADTLKNDDAFVGLIVNTSVRGRYLDGDDADSFFAMAAELDVPVLLHPPAEPAGSASVTDFRLVEQVGRFNDVTMSVAAVVFAGWLEKYPTLELIAATAGGAIGLLPAKLDLAHRPLHWGGVPGRTGGPPSGPASGAAPQEAAPTRPLGPPQYANRITRAPSELLRRVNVDTASPSGLALRADLDAVGAGRLLFGTDAPPLSTPLRDALGLIDQLPLSAEERDLVLYGNARRLFKLDGFSGTP